MAKNSANIDDVKIGLKIRQARAASGMTQSELAKYFGVSGQQVQKFELGFNKISAKNLFVLSKVFKKPMEWFTEELDKIEYEIQEKENEDENQIFLNQAIRNLRNIKDDSGRCKIIKIIKIFTEKPAKKINNEEPCIMRIF